MREGRRHPDLQDGAGGGRAAAHEDSAGYHGPGTGRPQLARGGVWAEVSGAEYITSFLGRESPAQGPIDPQHRGHIGTKYPPNPGSLPGYRWVEVLDPQDGLRYRYSARYEERWQNDKKYLKGDFWFNLDKTPSPSKTPPRYAVTFEDHVIPEERALWVASSTVKVLDLKTNEVLGEMTRYAISYIHAPSYSMPWLNHSVCPTMNGPDGARTRHFVDQILIPKKDP